MCTLSKRATVTNADQNSTNLNKMETTNPNVHTLYWGGPVIIRFLCACQRFLSMLRCPALLSTTLLRNSLVKHSSPPLIYTLLYNTLPQLVCTTLLNNTLLQHFSKTQFPNSSLQHSSLLQHFSTTLFPNSSLQHSSPTLLHNTLPQLVSTTLFSNTSLYNTSLEHSSPALLYNSL